MTYFVDTGPMGFVTEEQFQMTVWRGHFQFFVKVDSARIKGTSFGKELLKQIRLCKGYPFGRNQSLANPLDMVYQLCLPHLTKLAPQTSLQDPSLENFLHSPTYHLKLIDTGVNEEVGIEGEDSYLSTLSFSLFPMLTIDLDESCKALPRFQALRTWLAPSREESASLDSVQGRVVTAQGRTMYFKPRIEGREAEFTRELQILLHVAESGLNTHIKVPTIEGIVVSGDDGETTVGFMINLIDSPEMGTNLLSRNFHGEPELCKKWEAQVTAIVKELHAHGIVWGDVNPSNVMIDKAMDAWVVDFGGMNNVEFVDEEKRETEEGDEQGIKRLFREWLPSRVKSYKE